MLLLTPVLSLCLEMINNLKATFHLIDHTRLWVETFFNVCFFFVGDDLAVAELTCAHTVRVCLYAGK